MAEKINIFTLDLDVDAALKASKDLKVETSGLKSKLDDLKKGGKENSQQFVELEARYKSVRKEYNSSQAQLGQLINLQGKEIKTIEQGRSALSAISKEWAKQADLYGVNSKEADNLAKKKMELTERLKDLESQTGDNTRNVGNYTGSMKEAIMQSGLFQRAQQGVNDAGRIAGPIITFVSTGLKEIKKDYALATVNTAGLSKAQIAANISSSALAAGLKLVKLALIATGVGAFVVIVGSLIAYFSQTQDGIDFVNKSLAQMGAFFNLIIDRVAKFGGAVKSFMSGNFKEGIDGMTDAFKGMGDEMQREIDLAGKLETALQGVAKEEVNLSIRRSAANARLKDLNKTIEDKSKTEEERLAAAKEYARLDEQLTGQEVSNQEKKVAAMLGFAEVTDEVRNKIKKIGEEGISLDQLGISESTLEDAKAFETEISKLFDIQAASDEKQTTNKTKLNTIVQQIRAKEEADAKAASDAASAAQEKRIAEAKKATDAAISESKTRLQIFIEENKGKADSLAEEVKLAEDVKTKKINILQEELTAKKLTQSEYELAILQTKNEFLDQQAQLTSEYADKDIEAKRLQLEQSKELEDQEKARKVTDLENEMELARGDFEAQLEIEKQQLEAQRLQEIAAAEKTGADVALINKKYAQVEEDIEYYKESTKRKMAADTFGEVADLLGKQTVAGKAAAIAQATINTYQGITEVWRSPSILPEPFATAAKVISTGVVLGSGLSAVQKITSTNAPKLEEGGLMKIGGKRHSAGGTKFVGEDGTTFEAEQGELIGVVNRRAAMMVQGLNDNYPVNAGLRSANYFAAGGFVTKGAQSTSVNVPSMDYEKMAQMNAEAMSNVQIYTAVTEINNGQGKYARIVDEANF